MTAILSPFGALADAHPVAVEMIGMALAIVGVGCVACPALVRLGDWLARRDEREAGR